MQTKFFGGWLKNKDRAIKMMEVKQNTAVDLSDLLTSSKNSGTDEVDDAVMQDLSDATAAGLINCDIMEANGMYVCMHV